MFQQIDEWLYRFLSAHVDDMPLRFVKLIAYYYTDARIRREYLKRLGVLWDREPMQIRDFAWLGAKMAAACGLEIMCRLLQM